MNILEFKELKDKDDVLQYLSQCAWPAARFLAELIKTRRLAETLGENPRVFFLLDGDRVVSFATLTHQDAVRDETLYPWIGFVYTDERYRGHRHSRKVIEHAVSIARKEGMSRVYLATGETGLYEKYGFVYMEDRIDAWGEDSRVYRYEIK